MFEGHRLHAPCLLAPGVPLTYLSGLIRRRSASRPHSSLL